MNQIKESNIYYFENLNEEDFNRLNSLAKDSNLSINKIEFDEFPSYSFYEISSARNDLSAYLKEIFTLEREYVEVSSFLDKVGLNVTSTHLSCNSTNTLNTEKLLFNCLLSFSIEEKIKELELNLDALTKELDNAVYKKLENYFSKFFKVAPSNLVIKIANFQELLDSSFESPVAEVGYNQELYSLSLSLNPYERDYFRRMLCNSSCPFLPFLLFDFELKLEHLTSINTGLKNINFRSSQFFYCELLNGEKFIYKELLYPKVKLKIDYTNHHYLENLRFVKANLEDFSRLLEKLELSEEDISYFRFTLQCLKTDSINWIHPQIILNSTKSHSESSYLDFSQISLLHKEWICKNLVRCKQDFQLYNLWKKFKVNNDINILEKSLSLVYDENISKVFTIGVKHLLTLKEKAPANKLYEDLLFSFFNEFKKLLLSAISIRRALVPVLEAKNILERFNKGETLDHRDTLVLNSYMYHLEDSDSYAKSKNLEDLDSCLISLTDFFPNLDYHLQKIINLYIYLKLEMYNFNSEYKGEYEDIDSNIEAILLRLNSFKAPLDKPTPYYLSNTFYSQENVLSNNLNLELDVFSKERMLYTNLKSKSKSLLVVPFYSLKEENFGNICSVQFILGKDQLLQDGNKYFYGSLNSAHYLYPFQGDKLQLVEFSPHVIYVVEGFATGNSLNEYLKITQHYYPIYLKEVVAIAGSLTNIELFPTRFSNCFRRYEKHKKLYFVISTDSDFSSSFGDFKKRKQLVFPLIKNCLIHQVELTNCLTTIEEKQGQQDRLNILGMTDWNDLYCFQQRCLHDESFRNTFLEFKYEDNFLYQMLNTSLKDFQYMMPKCLKLLRQEIVQVFK